MTSRRRVAAGLSALIALTAGFVLAGSVAALADDGLEITGPASAAAGTVEIVGTKNAEVSGIIVRNGPTVADPLLCNIAPTADPTWQCDAALETGHRIVSAYQGARTATFGINVGTFTAPAIGNGDSYEVPYGGTANFFGAVTHVGGPGSSVQVTMSDLAASCTDATIGAGGEWSCSIDLAAAGASGGSVYSASVQQLDLGGMASPTSEFQFFYQTPIAPTLQIDSPAENATVTWAPAITIAGTAPLPTPDVSLDLDGVPLTACANLPVDGARNWSCSVEVAVGSHTVQAHQGSSATAVRTFEVTYPAPSVSTPASHTGWIGPENDVLYQGTATYPGVTISVTTSPFVGSCTVATPLAAGASWQCAIPANVATAGSYEVIVRQLVGGTPIGDAWTGDLLLTAGLEISSPTEGELVDWTPSGVVISGYTWSPDAITVYLDGEHEVCSIPAPTSSWSCGPVPIDIGPHFLTAQQYMEPDSTVNFEVVSSAVTPTLNCTFTPNGGFAATPAQALDTLDLSRVLAYDPGSMPSTAALGERGACGTNTGLPFTPYDTIEYEAIDACSTAGCSAGGLAPGDYEVYYTVNDGLPGYDYEPHSFLFRIPAAPVISTVASTTNSVVLSGTAAPGDSVRLERPAGGALCSTTATASGTWACQFPRSTATSAHAITVDAQSGGMSAYSPARAIPAAATPVTTQPSPPSEPLLVRWFLEFGGDLSDLKPGDSFTLNVSGMPEGTSIEVWMHSTPRLLGTATGTGAPMQMQLTVPADIENGPHEIEMIAVTPLGTNYFFRSDAMVSGGVDPVDKAEDPVEEPAEDPSGAGAAGSGGDGGDRSDPAAPSALTDALPTFERIVANPIAVAVAGGLALALLFFVALPTELLNSSLASNTSRLGRVYGAIDGALSRVQDRFIAATRSRALAAALLTTVVAIVYGFVDPNFGFDLVSLRLVLSLALAFFILSFGASWLSGLIIRRLWGASGVVSLQPSIVLFAIVGVVVARILDFSPGFLVGIAIGLELIQASKHVSARAVFVQLAVVTGFALAAWGVYSVFAPGDDFVGMLAEDTLVAITAEGLTGAMIAIFPLRFLDGRELWEVSKRLWLLAFLIIGVAFALLVMPTAIEGTEVADYGVWLLVFAAFGLVSVLIWLVFARAAKREEAAEESAKVDASRSTAQYGDARR